MTFQFLCGGFDHRNTCNGGSETCVIYLAERLAARGHRVVVVNGSVPEKWNKVEYTHTPIPCCNVLVSWRNYNVDTTGIEYSQLWLWCHDIPVGGHAPQGFDADPRFHKVITLNEAHASLYRKHFPVDRVVVSRIGVPEYYGFWDQPRVPGKCVYCSHPHRGLAQLRAMWPRIKAACPEATLHAFWWQPEFFLPPDEALGIMPMRGVNDEELARELQSAELFTYPSVFTPEISPAALIKAQIAGAVPIVVVASEGMRQSFFYGHEACMNSYVDSVVNAIRDKDFQEKQRACAGTVEQVFDWGRTAVDWIKWANQ